MSKAITVTLSAAQQVLDDAVTCAYINAALIAYKTLLHGDDQVAHAILRAAAFGKRKRDRIVLAKNFSASDQTIIRKLVRR